MSDTKPTARPWKARRIAVCEWAIDMNEPRFGKPSFVWKKAALVYGIEDDLRGEDIAEANARLIAAAPDLLRWRKEAEDVLTQVWEYLDQRADVIDGDEDGPRPNRAMQLMRDVDMLIGKVRE